MELYKINEVSISRIENIKNWVRKYETQEELQLAIDDIVSRLRFGVVADKFEQALDELARALGFVSQRPDKEWKEGPDNLWKISDNQYMLFECKNNVDTNREEINKDECGQMNNSCAWFTRNYGDSAVKRIMIVPTRLVSSAAGFNVPVEIMRENKLKLMVNNVRKFYKEFKAFDLKSLSDVKLQELLVLHKLTINELISEMYSDQPKPN